MQFLNRLNSWVRNSTYRILGFLEDRLAPLTLIILVAVLTLSILFWDSWSGKESDGMAIRNPVLVITAIAALPLAIWRSKVAERQAKTAQRQAETAQRGLMNERYQEGAEMLGSEILSVRLGGIYALARLAREHPEDHHTQIMRLFCAFVRHPVGEPVEAALPIKGSTPATKFNSGQDEADDEDSVDRPLRVREDVQAVMTSVGECSEAQIKTEEREKYRLDLRDAKLKSVRLVDADLNHTNLPNADLTSAVLVGAKLKGAYLNGANFENANLLRADLTGAVMRRWKGLTQEQINQAMADKADRPKLEGAIDADTGEQLKWLGGVDYISNYHT